MTKRKITQVEVASFSSLLGASQLIVYALCDDGTLWARSPWIKDNKFDKIDISEIEKD